MKAFTAARESPGLSGKQLTDSRAWAATGVQTVGAGCQPPPPTHSCLCQQKGALSLQASSPSFLLKTPAFPPSQTRGTLPVDDGVLISPPGLPAVRCRCPLQLKTPWVPGAVSQEVQGCQHSILTRPEAQAVPSPGFPL